ncbi:MAG TPA: ABC transporter substrate-binding protein, partial [Burkholderiales bacterium]|nr:ABC transporter substrate-binding protein [Burkholderiales bacterium]
MAILWTGSTRSAELRIGLAADVTSMDPHFLNIAPNINIAWHVFDALTHVDEDARLIPGLAVSWRAI